MSRYRFQLESIRRLRMGHRDQQRQRLGEAIHAETLLEQQIQSVQQELVELKAQQRAVMSAGILDVNRLLDSQRYEMLVQAQLKTMAGQRQTLQAEVQRRRELLADAEKEVKVLDKLDERRQQEHAKEALRQEELVLGEMATTQFLQSSAHEQTIS